jgi:hypothetical protein
LIAPGTPTNAVDGEPAADLGRDPEMWRQWVLTFGEGQVDPASQAVSKALTGRPDWLGQLPGDESIDHPTTGRLLVQALWTVLWGHALKDIWGLGPDVHLAGLWAGDFLSPEGPLPPLRIGDQPYGLLPTTQLGEFVPSGKDAAMDELEMSILPSLVEARAQWAEVAETGGNVTGADTARLLQLLGRTPSANAYAYRSFLALDLFQILCAFYTGGFDSLALQAWLSQTSGAIQSYSKQPPIRDYVTAGYPQDLRIPLVAPEEEPRDRSFAEFLKDFMGEDPYALVYESPGFWMDGGECSPFDKLPDSLLAHLLMLAKLVTAAEVHRFAKGQPGPTLEPLSAEVAVTDLARDAMAMDAADLSNGGVASKVYDQFLYATEQILDLSIGELERALRAALDTAAYRLDPWITAPAWRRLQESIDAGHPFHLGIYGWVDAPQPGDPGPGPTDGGLLHAPSQQQALAAVILRDKAIHDPEVGRWDMNLESSTIRLAERFAEEVRLGSHIGEVLGREVERIAGSKATIDGLRQRYPLRTEHAGRRVCDGQAVLAAKPDSLPLSDDQRAALEPLRRAVDTYGDLLVAEAVYHVVAGRGAVASAAMEAAIGLKAPPNLEVISTRRTGRAVNTNVVVALPSAADPTATFDASPGEIADPAVAAYVNQALGPTQAAPWLWRVLTPDGKPHDVFLSTIGLTPLDTVVLSEEELVRLVLMTQPQGSLLDVQWCVRYPDGTLHTVRLSDLGLSVDEILSLTEADLEELVLQHAPEGSAMVGAVPSEGTRAQRRARRIVQILGRQPAVPADLVAPADLVPADPMDTVEPPDDALVKKDLRGRYQRLRDAAQLLSAKLREWAKHEAEEVEIQALILAARWGITPVVQIDDTRADRVWRAGEALQERFDRSPSPADIAQLDAPGLAAAIAELAAPEGQLAVLGRIDLSDWPTKFTAAPTLDAEWLAVNAAVREPLARLEAHQLEGLLDGSGAPFEAWTNRPDDPWQLTAPVSESEVKAATRLVAIYGPSGVLPAASGGIAAGLLDSWGETVPDVDQSTTAAFGFNAPAARAPQAILLAVPPHPEQALTPRVLVKILAETRELAHARMATPDELSRLAAALPLIMLPKSGITAVPLEPRP